MGYWRSRVVPAFKSLFDKGGAKKSGPAAEASRSFDESKAEIDKLFEEKKAELGPKVLEIYGSSSPEIKDLVKERTVAGLEKHAAGVDKLLEELVKIGFPGAVAAKEAAAKSGSAPAEGPVFSVFEKVASLLPAPEPVAASKEEEASAVAAEEGGGKEEEVAGEGVEAGKAPAGPVAPATPEEKPPSAAEEAPVAPVGALAVTEEKATIEAAVDATAAAEEAPVAPAVIAATEEKATVEAAAPVPAAAGETAVAPGAAAAADAQPAHGDPSAAAAPAKMEEGEQGPKA